MKKKLKVVLFFAGVLLLTGCSKDAQTGRKIQNGSSVNKVISSQISDRTESAAENVQKTEAVQSTEAAGKDTSQGSVDYDLTQMSSDMVYATVYQMMMHPEEYTGKRFRMSGSYYAVYYEATKKYYHYCIIQDATACCSQGMEFIWEDGSHKYPDEYPKENSTVTVEGVFETYTEEGDKSLYCRLINAKLQVEMN